VTEDKNMACGELIALIEEYRNKGLTQEDVEEGLMSGLRDPMDSQPGLSDKDIQTTLDTVRLAVEIVYRLGTPAELATRRN
jgi:hypothetical protein